MSSTPPPSPDFQIRLTEHGRVYVRSNAAVNQVVSAVREGHYCTIVGPRYCHKTQLLKDVKETLAETGGEFCVLLDLRALSVVSGSEFLHAFAGLVHHDLEDLAGASLPAPDLSVSSPRTLQRYLQGCVQVVNRDLILLLNRLDRVHIASLRALLLVLRAIHSERKQDDPFQLGVVTAGTLSVADLALGPTSPFNIARLIWMQDLRPEESEKLVEYVLARRETKITQKGLVRLMAATKGDRYLVPMLSDRCAVVAAERKKNVTVADVNESVEWFLNSRTEDYPALAETLQTLKSDAVALWNILDILEHGRVARNKLRIDLEKEIDSLRLTGAIRVEGDANETFYCIRNEIYEAYLKRKLLVSIVVDTLRTGGLREEAIDYLEFRAKREPQLRSKLLSTVVDSIFAAESASAAYGPLARQLQRMFGFVKVRIYAADQDSRSLRIAGQVGFEDEPVPELSLDETDRPECQAYRSLTYEVFQDSSGVQVVAVPLSGLKDEVLAVAVVYGCETDPQHEQFQELLWFVMTAAGALREVMDRERLLHDFERVYERWKQVPTSLDLDRVFAATLEAAMRAVPTAENGSMFLWDSDLQKLVIASSTATAPGKGLPPDLARTVQLRKGEGYVGWVYENRKPVLLKDASADKRTRVFGPVQEQSAICVPLEAWGSVIGALCLQNVTQHSAFQSQDLAVLYSFAGQAALAVQNARFTKELYDLGMRINRRDANTEQIFRAAVQSIRKVTGAKAANMFLLRHTDDPELSPSEPPLLSISDGFPDGEVFDKTIRSRPDGVTASVLRDPERRPVIVPDPHSPPGINPLALERGIQAYICLPLMIQELVIGVLFVHYEEPHTFSENEIRMLSLFASQTALAIENARQRDRLALNDTVVWMGITFSTIAHDTNQHLLQINVNHFLLSAALTRDGSITEEITKALVKIKGAAEAIAEIPTRSLLPPTAQDAKFDLNQLLHEQIPHWCKASSVQPHFHGPAEPIEIKADRDRIAFVVRMLAQNAVRAVRAAGFSELTVEIEIRGGWVQVRISNPGKPIPEEVQALLFTQPVTRAQGAQGTGIGLVIAGIIVRSYGGEIRLVETSSERTMFEFTLPRPSLGTTKSAQDEEGRHD